MNEYLSFVEDIGEVRFTPTDLCAIEALETVEAEAEAEVEIRGELWCLFGGIEEKGRERITKIPCLDTNLSWREMEEKDTW